MGNFSETLENNNIVAPKVSIIIPVYNVEPYIREAFDSILNQTLSEIELICIDDCSTDNSLAILNEYAQKDSRVKVFHLEENKGQGYARNFGLEKVTGECIGFVDPDDWIEPDMYETLYNYIQEYNVDLVDSHYALHREQAWGTEIEYYKSKLEYPENEAFDKFWNKEYLFTHNLGPCGKLYKTSLIRPNNIKFEEGRIAEDQIFVIKSRFFANKIYFCEKYLYNYRVRNNSTMGFGFANGNTINRFQSLLNIKTFLKELDAFKTFKKYFYNFAVNVLVYNYRRCAKPYKKEFHQAVKKFLPRKYYLQYKLKRRYYKNLRQILISKKDMLFPEGSFQVLTILGIKIKLKKYVR